VIKIVVLKIFPSLFSKQRMKETTGQRKK